MEEAPHGPEHSTAGPLEPDLPVELLRLDHNLSNKVLAALPPASLAVAACASPGLRTASESEALWQEHCTSRRQQPHKHLRESMARASHCLQDVLTSVFGGTWQSDGLCGSGGCWVCKFTVLLYSIASFQRRGHQG